MVGVLLVCFFCAPASRSLCHLPFDPATDATRANVRAAVINVVLLGSVSDWFFFHVGATRVV
jgi:hypothetical protein